MVVTGKSNCHVSGASHDCLALGHATVRRAEELGRDCAGEADRDPHAAPQLRTPSADERHPHQLPVALAEALFDTDDAHLPGACA